MIHTFKLGTAMLKPKAIEEWTTDFIATYLDVDPSAITGDALFVDIGLDSVDAVGMGGALEEHFGIEVDTNIFLRNSTINEMIADLKSNGIVE